MPVRVRHRQPVLAIDLGTSSVRSALFDSAAEMIPNSIASRPYQVTHSVTHSAELDPAAVLRATQHCLRQTHACLTKQKVLAIAASGFWHSLLGLDQNRCPLTPIYTWADSRGEEDAARLREQFSERALQRRTGCMLRST